MFNYCFRIASKPMNKLIVNILKYSLLSISVFFMFLFMNKEGISLPVINKYNRMNLFLFYEILFFVYSIYLLFYTGKNKLDKELLLSIDKLPIHKKKKYSFYLFVKLIPTIIASVISLILLILFYVIFFLVLKNLYGYKFELNIITCLMTLIIPSLISFIAASYSFLDYFNSEFFDKYDLVFFISALISIFLYIFINRSIIVFVLFVLSASIFIVSAVYNLIYFYSLRKRVNLSRRSSFIYLLIRRKNIAYYVFAVLVMFVNVVFIASNYNKFKDTSSFYKYDYILETNDPNEYLEELITSNEVDYNVINSKIEIVDNNEKYNLYSLDLTKFKDFYNIDSLEAMYLMPENAIILPRTIYNENNHYLGERIKIEIGRVEREFVLYGFINDMTGCNAFTNVEIESNSSKYILINDLIQRSSITSYNSLNKMFGGNLHRKFEIDGANYYAAIFKLVASVILFIFISFFVITTYILERRTFDESIEYDKTKLLSANLKTDEVFKTILSANYLMFVLSFTVIFILLIMVSFYNTNYINIIFKVNYSYVDISGYFIYLLEIFTFFTIIIFVDYLVEKGKVDHEF